METEKFQDMLQNGFVIRQEDCPIPSKTEAPLCLAMLAVGAFIGFIVGFNLNIAM